MLDFMKQIILFLALIYLVIPPYQTYTRDLSDSTPKLLVETGWLSDNLNDPSLIILHIGKKDDYEDTHIPGAHILSLRSIIEDERNGLSHEMPAVKKLQKAFSSVGISDDSKIVIYYDNGQAIPFATRVFITLEYLGFADKTFLLNGGLPKWLNEERAVTDKIPVARTGKITIQPYKKLIVDAKWVNEKLQDPSFVVIDARPEGQYNGREEDHNAARDGHIASAVNIPFYSLTDEDDAFLFKSISELEKIFIDAGAVKGTTVITYCGSGIWAAPVYFAARHLGYTTCFFDGSYQEWSADEKLPVTGPVKQNAF